MKRLTMILVILAMMLALPLALLAAPVGKITHIEGNVDITAGEKVRTARLGEAVSSGEILRAKSKSRTEITFADGNILRLAENTRVRITDYQMGEGKTSTLDLFRGKTQSIVSGLAKNGRYEIHTSTAICGVRGTDFIAFFQNGVSGFMPKEGTIYGYNRNMPGDVKTVTPGQAITVPAANKPAAIQTSTSAEMERHVSDTAPADRQEKKEEGAAPRSDAAAPQGSASGATETVQAAAGEAAPATVSPDAASALASVMDPAPVPNPTPTAAIAPTTPVAPLQPPPLPPPAATEPPSTASSTALAGPLSRMMDGTVRSMEYRSLYRLPSAVQGTDYDFSAGGSLYKTVRYESMYFEDAYSAVNLGYRFENPEYLRSSGAGTQTWRDSLNIWYWPNRSYYTTMTYSPIRHVAGRGSAFAPDNLFPNLDLSANPATGGNSQSHPFFPGTQGSAASFPADYAINGATAADPGNLWGHGTFVKTAGWSYANANSGEEIGTFGGTLGVRGSDPMELFASSTATAPAGITLAGNYAQNGTYMNERRTLGFSSVISSFVAAASGYGGAYYGQLQGLLPDAGSTVPLQGTLYALYVYTPDAATNRAGILFGRLTEGASSTTDPGLRTWQADGQIYRLADAALEKDLTVAGENPAGVTAANIAANIVNGLGGIDGTAGFYSPTSPDDPTLTLGMGRGWFPSIRGFDRFGLFFLSHDFMNRYNGTPATAAAWESAGWGEFGGYIRSDRTFYPDLGYWYAAMGNRSWGGGKLSAGFDGRFLTLNKYGTMTGETLGNYESGLWGASSQGYWKKDGDLAFASTVGGEILSLRREQSASYTEIGGASSYSYGISDPAERLRSGRSSWYNAANNTSTHVKFDRLGPGREVFVRETWETADGGATWSYGAPVYYANEAAYNAALNGIAAPPAGSWTPVNAGDQYQLWKSHFEGILGGLNYNLWMAKTSPIRLQGSLDWMENPKPSPSLAVADFMSVNPLVDIDPKINSTSRIGGAYRGRLGVAVDSANALSGGLMALYQDNAGSGGILYSNDITGVIHPAVGAWMADGNLSLYPLTSLATATNLFAQNVLSGQTDRSYAGGQSPVEVISGGPFEPRVHREISQSLSGQPWGIWQTVAGGICTGGSAPGSWTERRIGEMNPGGGTRDTYLHISMGAPDRSISTGSVAGAAVVLNQPSATGQNSFTVVQGGVVKGLFDPATTPMSWSSIAQGGFMETGNFLAKQAAMNDAAKANFERAMKIPSFDVGTANLSGSNGNLSVSMNDIKFFRFQTEANPRIWATETVAGTYAATPTVGARVTLTGSGGLSGLQHTFEVKQWNTGNNSWGADIYRGAGDTGGTLTRTETRTLPAGASPTIAITEMRGGAAGAILPGTGGGSFGGTAAGTVR